jgi:hypothetical protein
VDLETDCATVVTKVRSNDRDCSVISSIIGDIKEIMWSHGTCRIQKVWRVQNCIAHNLAQFALRSRTSRVSLSVISLCIQDLVYNDHSRCTNAGDIT